MLQLAMLVTAFFITGSTMAQPGGPQVQSPVVNKDNSVTFNYLNKTAQKVEVDVQFAGRHEMKKDDKGVCQSLSDLPLPTSILTALSLTECRLWTPLTPNGFPTRDSKTAFWICVATLTCPTLSKTFLTVA